MLSRDVEKQSQRIIRCDYEFNFERGKIIMKAKVNSCRFWPGIAPVSPVIGFASAGDFGSGSKARVLIGTRNFLVGPVPREVF